MTIDNSKAIEHTAHSIITILIALLFPVISFASDWTCYSPTTSSSSIVASSGELEGNKKITIGSDKFICFNEMLNPEKVNVLDYAAGVPFRFTKNPGEYVFSIDPDNFTPVQESGRDALRGFKSIAFDLEDGGEWRIQRQSDGYISSENQVLKAGINEQLGLIYFFNLSKSDFNYTVLQIDGKQRCAWSEWPGIHSLNWDGWHVCDTPPRLKDKENREDRANDLPEAAQAWMAGVACADVSEYVVIRIAQSELCAYTDWCSNIEGPPDLHRFVFCKGRHREDCNKESGKSWLLMSDIFAFDPKKIVAHNVGYHFTKLNGEIYSKKCLNFQSLSSNDN